MFGITVATWVNLGHDSFVPFRPKAGMWVGRQVGFITRRQGGGLVDGVVGLGVPHISTSRVNIFN